MTRKAKDLESLNSHAQRRDVKRCKKHHLTDNRKSIRLISQLSVKAKDGRKKT